MVKAHDVTISFIPPFLHMHVFKAAVKCGSNLVSSSYISPAMLELDDQIKAKGLTFVNECGLDPGIDIMSTMKVVNEARAQGHKVVGYESWCGGIPVAE